MTDKLRVLVVDDSKVVRKAFTRILAEEYDLVEANDGEEAWAVLCQDEEVCAVFTDLSMPNLDGQGLLERIRSAEDEELKKLPVVVVTASEDDAEITKSALQAGATDYVIKPFDSIFLRSKASAYVKPRDKGELSDAKLATLDPLTRLANKAYFIERGNQDMSLANRRRADLALLIIGVDDFAELGGKVGGPLLKGIVRKLGSYISSEVRLEDSVARIEKDRFAILLADTGLQGAIEMGERIRSKVGQKVIRHKEDTFEITVSIGISALPAEIKRTFDMLMVEAERHLKEALAQGGDCVVPQTADAVKSKADRSGAIASIDEAIAMLKRREQKLTTKQAEFVIKSIMPILEYCDQLLGLGMADNLKKIKQRYKMVQ